MALVGTIVPILGSVTVLAVAPFAADWLREQGIAGVVYFTATFALLGAVAFAPTYTTSIVAGWTFGFTVGFTAIIIGMVSGAALCYGAARWLAAERVSSTFDAHPRAEVVRRALVEASPWRTLWLVFLLRLTPVLPFGTTNILLATTGVPLPIYLLGTMLGMAPRTALIALAAAGAEQLEMEAAGSWWLLGLGAAATVACIIAFAVIGKRALDRATRS